jgi:hypothetical protein
VTAPAPGRPWSVWTPLGISLAVVAVLATVGSFGAGFGVMTACTDEYSCTETTCSPCATASTWLAWGWAAQGLLLIVAVVLAVLGARRRDLHTVRWLAWVLAPLSIALFLLTTWQASGSY